MEKKRMKKASWYKKGIDKSLVKSLHENYNIDLITASILSRRNIVQGKNIKFYLEHDILYLHNPFLFEDMDIAVERILLAKQEKEKVRIFGDRDVDGMTSTILLKERLDEEGLDVSWKLPAGDEPYGLTKEGVDAFAAEGGTLIITVDCGITNVEEVAYAAQLGIDTVILDHHLCSEILPPAVAVIDPKIEGSGYPFKNLAGCGVAAKFIWALNFSQTELYQQEIVLLHARPGNETVIIEAVKLENMIEIDRIIEEVNPGVLPAEQSRLWEFLLDRPIFVYDQEQEISLLKQAFGKNTQIGLLETADEIWKFFPSLKGNSLVQLDRMSKAKRYYQERPLEIDVFLNVFQAYMYRKYPKLSSEFIKILDLVAIGTVADLMPMKDENRILIKYGLRVLNAHERPSLRTFLYKRKLLEKKLSTTDIGWQISPIWNAAGRLGVPELAVEMLLSKDEAEQEALIDQMVNLNKKRKKLGEDAWSRLYPKAGKSFEDSGERLIVVDDKQLNRGITGIIASRLMNNFHVPAMVIAHLDDKLIGSMRSSKEFHVKDFLSKFDDILLDYGGHQCAGGFSLPHENMEKFISRVKEKIAFVEPQDTVATYEIDAELPKKYVNPNLIHIVEKLEPYGEDHPPLIFMVRDVEIEEMTEMGNTKPLHLRLLISTGKHKWPAVFWRAADRVPEDFASGEKVDILFRLGKNYFKQQETLQLTILDITRNADTVLTNSM